MSYYYAKKMNNFLREQGKTNKPAHSKRDLIIILKDEYDFEINPSKKRIDKEFKRFLEEIGQNKPVLFPLSLGTKKLKAAKKAIKRFDKQIEKKYQKKGFITFYESKEWLILRARVLSMYEERCMRCSAEKVEMHVDHIKPRSKYPELELIFENLQILCRKCNMLKWNTDETDYRPYAILRKKN